MVKIEFEIIGNPDDPKGNPIPKLKMTGRQHWTPQAKRYVRWKEYVESAYLKNEVLNQNSFRHFLAITSGKKSRENKPIKIEGKKARMDIFITWKDNRRPDPENVFGSIADALFVNDKNLAGSFDFNPHPTGKGSVKVQIII